MSLPSLVELPASLISLAERAEQSLQMALIGHQGLAESVAAWPAARRESWRQVTALSDFVAEQSQRDPQMFVELGESGELERSLAPGELREQLGAWLADCTDEDALGRCLRRFRNRQQLRIIWRDFSRQAALAETCRDLSDLADACIDLAYHWLYPRYCAQFGTPIGRRSGQPQHMVILGMGKLGAHELNLSSDIDLIFGYP
jgi:glutamate-ammonia-ligase adenylyltransferase